MYVQYEKNNIYFNFVQESIVSSSIFSGPPCMTEFWNTWKVHYNDHINSMKEKIFSFCKNAAIVYYGEYLSTYISKNGAGIYRGNLLYVSVAFYE